MKLSRDQVATVLRGTPLIVVCDGRLTLISRPEGGDRERGTPVEWIRISGSAADWRRVLAASDRLRRLYASSRRVPYIVEFFGSCCFAALFDTALEKSSLDARQSRDVYADGVYERFELWPASPVNGKTAAPRVEIRFSVLQRHVDAPLRTSGVLADVLRKKLKGLQ